MKKGWKITLIVLGSVAGLAVVVAAVALWLILTPARLTSIANTLAKDYVKCEVRFERVGLTLFKTWPNAGLRVDNMVVVNPCRLPADNPFSALVPANDTLASVGSLSVGLDLRSLISDGSIIVRQLQLEDGFANIYKGADGWSSFDVFATEKDTTPSSGNLPETIDLRRIRIKNLSARYCDLAQSTAARADGFGLSLRGGWKKQAANVRLSIALPRLQAVQTDSLGRRTLDADLSDLRLALDGSGPLRSLDGSLLLTLDNGSLSLGGSPLISDQMQASRRRLLALSLPFHADIESLTAALDNASLSLLNYRLGLDGSVALPHDGKPMQTDMAFSANNWQIAELLALLPPALRQAFSGMTIDGRLSLAGTAVGTVAAGRLPVIEAQASIKRGCFAAPKLLPLSVRQINAGLTARLNLSTDSLAAGPSAVVVERFDAQTGKSRVSLSGRVDDLLQSPRVSARLKGALHLPDLAAFLPETLRLKGSTTLDIKVRSRLSDITRLALDRIQASGTVAMSRLEVQTDSLRASSPQLRLALRLPIEKKTSQPSNDLIAAHITGGSLAVETASASLNAELHDPDIRLSLPNLLDKRQPLAAAFDIRCSRIAAGRDSLAATSDTLRLTGSIRRDTTQDNAIRQWNPHVDIDLNRLVLSAPNMSEAVRLASLRFNFRPEVCRIEEADILWGVSDYHLSGTVNGLEKWLSHEGVLRGSLDFGSHYADIDQLLSVISGMGADKDTLQQQRVEDNVPAEANPFIVPKDVDLTLNTHIDRCVAFDNDLSELAGSVSMVDGTAVLDQMGFTCKAARMQLTGVYKSPRFNHLFLGLDFHLLDIQIEELLDMIPTIDTLVPMLASFKGRGDFHLAAECNLDAYYKPKMSTLLGAAAISGTDLVVLDNEKLASIARLLQLKDWRQRDDLIGIDSLSVEATVFRKEIEVFPFLLDMNNYRFCIGGRHTLDNACNYHLELLKCPLPVRLAVDVKGSLSNPSIALGEVKYAELYKPEKRDALQSRTLAIKKMVREALEANVR